MKAGALAQYAMFMFEGDGLLHMIVAGHKRAVQLAAECGLPRPKAADLQVAKIEGGRMYCGRCTESLWAKHHGKAPTP